MSHQVGSTPLPKTEGFRPFFQGDILLGFSVEDMSDSDVNVFNVLIPTKLRIFKKLRVCCEKTGEPRVDNPALVSIFCCLFNRDPNNGICHNPYITG